MPILHLYRIYMDNYKQDNRDADEQTVFKNQQITKDVKLQNPSQLQFYKALLAISFCFLVLSSLAKYIVQQKYPHDGYNLKGNSKIQQQSEIEIKEEDLVKMSQMETIQNYSIINQTAFQQDQSMRPIPVNTSKRISIGSPSQKQNQMRILTIQKETKVKNSNCILINAINILGNSTIGQAVRMLKQAEFHKIIIISDQNDEFASQIWRQWVSLSKIQGFINTQVKTKVDSQYKFINIYQSDCSMFVYAQSNFIYKQKQLSAIMRDRIVKNNGSRQVLYSGSTKLKDKEIKLLNLNSTSLQQINHRHLNQYLFIFNSIYIQLITPLNFAYYAKYTIEELIVYPILALVQFSPHLFEISEIVHQIKQKEIIQFKQFSITQINKYQHVISKTKPTFFNKPEDLCFVSYPVIPQEVSYQNLVQYFTSLSKAQKVQNSTIVINLPYNFNKQSPILSKCFNFLSPYSEKGYNIRIRIRANLSVSSLSAYQAAFTYCPNSTVMVTSRHNVQFNPEFIAKILPALNFKYHFYFGEHRQVQSNRRIRFEKAPRYSKKKMRSEAMYYQEYFKNLQIFKSDLFKMMYFWILKCDEIDFYQAQASFVIPMLEMVRLNVGMINQQLYSIFLTRNSTLAQKTQLKSLMLYFEWSQIPGNILRPFQYNSLQNIAYRRQASQKIPRIIHQAWIGGKPVSQFQLKLQQTIKDANKNFDVILWRDENITAQNFPLTFALISRSLEYQKFSNRSYSAPIVSLIRYQIVYHQGGIYIDFKTQGRKNLSPFLKYQIFFIDVDYEKTHYGHPANVGNGIMGAIKNNYHLKLILTQLISEQKFNYKLFDFPKIVGGYMLRKTLTTKQLFTQAGYGFQLFSQKPGTGKPNLCSYISPFEKKQKNSQIFRVQQYQTGKIYSIKLPCKVYEQAYLIMYKVLAGTWKPKKKQKVHKEPMGTTLRNKQKKLKYKQQVHRMAQKNLIKRGE